MAYDLRITSRPSVLIPQAHQPGTAISHVKMYRDSSKFVTRGTDDTMRLWDVRNSKTPVFVWDSLPNSNERCQAAFSPNEKLVVTGTQATK
jgi:WD40 repeat protein